jgi:hypothetical protein
MSIASSSPSIAQPYKHVSVIIDYDKAFGMMVGFLESIGLGETKDSYLAFFYILLEGYFVEDQNLPLYELTEVALNSAEGDMLSNIDDIEVRMGDKAIAVVESINDITKQHFPGFSVTGFDHKKIIDSRVFGTKIYLVMFKHDFESLMNVGCTTYPPTLHF